MRSLLSAALLGTAAHADILVTEIHYNPPGGDDLQEFIEFKNISSNTLLLGGAEFDGIGDVTLSQTTIAPGGFLILAGNPQGFFSEYGFTAGGTYAGSLNNRFDEVGITLASGESSGLFYGDGGDEDPTILEDDGRSEWLSTPDGDGYSLVLLDPDDPELDIESPLSWRRSTNIGGSPGADEPLPANIGQIVVNEIRTRDGALSNDVVELFNAGDITVNLADWSLTDNLDDPRRLVLGDLTLEPGEYTVVDLAAGGIGLSSQGERIFLFSGNNGAESGYVDGFHFLASADGRTFSRHVNADGRVRYPQTAPTLGSANAAPDLYPVIISEIEYNPNPSTEFLEILNTSDETIALHHNGTNWRVEGINFTLNGSQPELASGEVALIVPIDPATFRSQNNLPASVQIFGPYPGSLSNSGEIVALQSPVFLDETDATRVSYIELDRVRYADSAPWPESPDNADISLVRSFHFSYGDESTAWQANPTSTDPGRLTNDYDLWRARSFPVANLTPSPTEDTAPNADFDGDGFSNLYAYALGLDPTIATLSQPDLLPAYVELEGIVPPTFQYRRVTNINPAATYTATSTSELTDLESWTTTGLTTNASVSGANGYRTDFVFEDTFRSDPRRFFRVDIEPIEVAP